MRLHHADDYLYRRAETELRMAEKAVSPAAVKAHSELAHLYLDRIHSENAGYDQVQSELVIGRSGGGR